MRHTKRIILLLLTALLVLPAIGCAKSEEAAPTDGSDSYTVARGDLSQEVSASGNLAFSNLEDLAFEMAGTVQDIFVEEGGAVTDGQVVATLDTTDWEKQLRSLKMSVLSAEIGLKQSEQALEAAKEETQTTITGDVVVNCCPDEDEVHIKEMQLEQARLRLEDAQAALDEHLAQSPEVVAPFDGFVTKVTAEGGDEVLKGSVAVTVVDPNRFEALIYVSENDITLVKEGTQAEVTIDSMSGVVLPARVTAVAPTATISSGVVNYQVTVELATVQELRANVKDAQPQMAERTQSGGLARGPSAAAALADVELREGLSVSVTLLIAQRTNVVLVPNAAISKLGNRSVVTVLAADGSEEQRTITTGISNWQFTEVVDGLAEGEVIKTYSNTAATTGGGRPNGPFVMGGPIHG